MSRLLRPAFHLPDERIRFAGRHAGQGAHPGHRVADALESVLPGRADAEPPQDAVGHPSTVQAEHPAALPGQRLLDPRPLVIRQLMTTRANRLAGRWSQLGRKL